MKTICFLIIYVQAIEVAGYICNYPTMSDIDNLKLQKLLFYSQTVHLVFNSEPLFSDEIQAWDYGPVIPSVYEKAKRQEKVHFPYNGTMSVEQMKSVMLRKAPAQLALAGPAGTYDEYKLTLFNSNVNITQRHIPAGICLADICHFQHRLNILQNMIKVFFH